MNDDRRTLQQDGSAADQIVRSMQSDVRGDGPPIVLVGGGLTGWRSWEAHAERLADTRTVVRLQLLNVQYGLENRTLPPDYSARMESAALAAALDAIPITEPVDLVGWSYGALVSLDFSLNHPERIRTLTLIEPPAAWVLPDQGSNDPDVQTLMSLETDGDIGEAELEWFARSAALVPPDVSARELPQWDVWFEHRRSLRGVKAPLLHRDDAARLRTFDRPVWLVTGTDTSPFLRRIQGMLADRLPQAMSSEMPAGHAPHIVSMDRFLLELERFQSTAGRSIHHVTSKDGTAIGFSKRGSGPPILFVHGTTADRRSWSAVTEHLEDRFTVVAMDRRGRGVSGDAPDYSFGREVEDVVAVAEAFDEPVALFGHSFGALCALEAAMSAKNVSRLILYEPWIPGETADVPEEVLSRLASMVERGELGDAMEEFLRVVAAIPEHELEAYRRTPLYASRIPLAATMVRELVIENGGYPADRARIAALHQPTLLLLGGESPDRYARSIRFLESTLPDSRVGVIPGQQHMAHHRRPDVVAQIVVEFLRQRADTASESMQMPYDERVLEQRPDRTGQAADIATMQ